MSAAVRGAIVLVGPPSRPAPVFNPPPLRTATADWESQIGALAQGTRGNHSASDQLAARAKAEGRLTRNQIKRQIHQFLVQHGAAAEIEDAGEGDGIIRVQDASNYGEGDQIPAVLMSNIDYGRIARVLADGKNVRLRMNIDNAFHPEGRTSYNLLAEFPGTDKRDEVVMIGGHFDSWSAGTGATDNAAGAAVMMEAMRLLKEAGVRPRRTIRLALWSGEEEGSLGSQAYVAEHFGSFERPKPLFEKFSTYINLDYGTGRPRAALFFGPAQGSAVIGEELSKFQDWGFTKTIRAPFRPSGSDSSAFYVAGLPALGLMQDPFDYIPKLHHTDLDVFDKAYEADLRVAAVEVASLAYSLAMSDKLVPRYGKSDIPPLGQGSALSRYMPDPIAERD